MIENLILRCMCGRKNRKTFSIRYAQISEMLPSRVGVCVFISQQTHEH